MTALIFLVTGIAMMTAVSGRRGIAIGLFSVGLIAAVVWLNHHMTDPLALSF
ncbi:MAG: DUF5993 family protein [Reyranellales bacterium]